MNRNLPVLIAVVGTIAAVIFTIVLWSNYRAQATYWGNNMFGNGYWLAPYNEHIISLEKVDSFFYNKAFSFEPNVDSNNKALSYALQLPFDGNTVVTVNVPVKAVKSNIFKFLDGELAPFQPVNKVEVTTALFNSTGFMLDIASKNVEAVDSFDFIKSLTIAVNE